MNGFFRFTRFIVSIKLNYCINYFIAFLLFFNKILLLRIINIYITRIFLAEIN